MCVMLTFSGYFLLLFADNNYILSNFIKHLCLTHIFIPKGQMKQLLLLYGRIVYLNPIGAEAIT